MSKVKFATCKGVYEYDATDMTKVEYEKIKWNLLKLSEKLMKI